MVDRLREVCLSLLPAAEEKRIVLDNGPTHFKTELIQFDFRLGRAVGIGEKIAGVEIGIADKLEQAAMKLIGAATGGNGDCRATVPALFR